MIRIDLQNQIAIVVGAGRGIGEAIALKLAEAGADVMVSDILIENAEKVAEKVRALGRKSKAFCVNVTNEGDINAMVDQVAEKYGKIDILINNAGFNVIKLFTESNSEEFDKMLNINLKGVYYGCKAALKYMVTQKYGHIVNTASQAAKAPFDYHSMYSASKFGVVGMSQVIAKEVGKYNINVNCICPGIVRTEMWEQNLREYDGYDNSIDKETRWGRVVANIPMQRPQEVDDMANAALFLCSDLSKNITGQALNINGGQVCV